MRMILPFRSGAILVGFCFCVGATSAVAADMTALVEDVKGRIQGVEFMDYVAAGRTLRLGVGDTLTLGYLSSCLRETITGGVVKIGVEQSEVTGGRVERVRIECDGGRLKLAANQATASGVMVFRSPPCPKRDGQPAEPQAIVYSLAPIFELRQAGAISIERLDAAAPVIELPNAGAQLQRGKFFDLGAAGHLLVAGGVYCVKSGARWVVFRIDPGAKAASGGALARLVKF